MNHVTVEQDSRLAAMMVRPALVLIMMAFVFALFMFGPPLAFAQNTTTTTTSKTTTTSSSSSTSTVPKKTTVNFEDQLIEGQTQKPELFYLLQQRSNNFKRLIKLRENFLPEMRDTAEDISRHGNGH